LNLFQSLFIKQNKLFFLIIFLVFFLLNLNFIQLIQFLSLNPLLFFPFSLYDFEVIILI
jgi:hypothetical protein